MIAKAVELLKGGCSGSIFTLRFLALGMEVPHQGHRPDIEARTFWGPMEILHGVKESILIIHQSVQGIGRPIGPGMIEGFLEIGGVGTQSYRSSGNYFEFMRPWA